MENKRRQYLGQTKDVTFRWATEKDPDLEQWRSLAEEWLVTIKKGKQIALQAVGKFLYDYLHGRNLSKVPAEFLKTDYPAESYYDNCLKHLKRSKDANYQLQFVCNFLDWVLEKYFSVENDDGNKFIPSEYHNPISLETIEAKHRGNLDESDKNTLPYRYIKQLCTIICPTEATSFQDWKWAQKATDSKRNGGDWFVVDYTKIDKDDHDCIWRKRESTKYERENKELPEVVYELWSPVRAVALYTKLLLPLRTYQVRMLDSGESDTYRYEQSQRHMAGQWMINNGLLKEGTEKHPTRRGVFRKFLDPITRFEMTGFYINTNKTSDIDKEEWAKGYEVPWQYEEVLYWLAKLRNWQEKYNPIEKPTAWTELEKKHIGQIKDEGILRQMGATCFLFRSAFEKKKNKTKPIRTDGLEPLWFKLLLELQRQCELLEGSQGEHKLKFIKNKHTTLYPLHSLRVSLITAYALEGGVPMPILSKCIVGHARLVMTFYYTKFEISYVSEKMDEAERKMAEHEQDSYMRWLKDATYKQLETYSASNDPASLQAVLNAQQSGVSFIKDDKGICPKGCMGCDTGGTYINDDTGKTSNGIVPGYPEQNCVRCRWFLTGPAFLPGLVHHFNMIGYNISETAERLMRFEEEIEELENLKFECEQINLPFIENEKLSKLEKLHQQEIQKNDKLANDYNATLRLIDRCVAVIKQPEDDGQTQFVAVGTMDDVQIALEDVSDKLSQIQTVCNGAEIFPETDASKAVLQRSQILDITFAMNGKRPIFFTLTPEQQLIAGNAWMQLLMSRAGSLKDAVPYIEGRKKLSEIGLEKETEDFVQNLELSGVNNQSVVRILGTS
ncbi:TPA: integrase family protein [Bacillus mycoides]|nr:integrase family protein [Bacillus mycoides]HDR7628770.1 integrase family protein [Bacillus mycoides]